jgi:hypothetical protein
MHLCMQDDHIGLKIMVLAPADMVWLPRFHNHKKISSKQPM